MSNFLLRANPTKVHAIKLPPKALKYILFRLPHRNELFIGAAYGETSAIMHTRMDPLLSEPFFDGCHDCPERYQNACNLFADHSLLRDADYTRCLNDRELYRYTTLGARDILIPPSMFYRSTHKSPRTVYARSIDYLSNEIILNQYYLPNVFNEGKICTGYNAAIWEFHRAPQMYYSTPCNQDLVSFNVVNNRITKPEEMQHKINEYIEIDPSYDHLLVSYIEDNRDDYFYLKAAGLQHGAAISKDPETIVIPAKQTQITRNGKTYRPYITAPDATGRHWLASPADADDELSMQIFNQLEP